MSKESAGKEITTLTVKLFAICVVVAGLLAWINSMTAPVIEANEQKEFEASMAEVLPDAESFDEIENLSFSPSESGVELDSAYTAKKGGDKCGYVVSTVCHEGYGGDISVMVGIDADLKVKQIKIMSMSETAGLGAKANNPEFYNQYSGLKSGVEVKKNNGGSPADNTISAISGATITSKAVTKAVNCALEAAAETGGAAK